MSLFSTAEGFAEWAADRPDDYGLVVYYRTALRTFSMIFPLGELDHSVDADARVLNGCRQALYLLDPARSLGDPSKVPEAAEDIGQRLEREIKSWTRAKRLRIFEVGALEDKLWELACDDAIELDRGVARHQLLRSALFRAEMPDEIEPDFERLRAFLADGSVWLYWSEFLERLLTGSAPTPIDRALLDLPDDDWNKGPAHIAGKITELQAQQLLEATPYALDIRVDVPKLALVAVPKDITPVYATTLRRVEHLLNRLRPTGDLPQKYQFAEPVVERLDDAFERFRDDPQWMHDEFMLSAKQLNALLDKGEIQSDLEVAAAVSALITGADDIRAADPVVRASVQARLQLRIDELRVEDTEEATRHLDAVAEVTEGLLFEELRHSANVLRATRDAPDAIRTLSGVDRSESVQAIYRSSAQISRSLPRLNDLLKWIENASKHHDRGQKVVAAISAAGSLIAWVFKFIY